MVKNLPANAGDAGLTLGMGRSPGEGNGYSLQYSGLKNPVDRGAWRAAAHAATRTRLSEHADKEGHSGADGDSGSTLRVLSGGKWHHRSALLRGYMLSRFPCL